MGDDLMGRTVTRQLVDAAVAASADSSTGIDIPAEAASFPLSCATAFDCVCSHALNLLLNDCSVAAIVPTQEANCIFDVIMRSVTVCHSLSLRPSLTCVSLFYSHLCFTMKLVDDLWNIVYDLRMFDHPQFVTVGDISGVSSIWIYN
jgi:hypothetical protein